MKRCLYFFYYLLNMDTSRHYLYMKYVRSTTGKSYFKQMYETAYFSLKYNIALSEYYLFRFYNLPHSERDQWAGTGFMYEYQKKMNPHPHRILLKDKWRFYQEYNRFFKHRVYFVNQLENQSDLTKTALHTDTGKLVFKKKEGNCGKNIAVL